MAPGHSVIENWTLDDGVARGTAKFAELNSYYNSDDPEPVDGTFGIVCRG